jgi:hypothetical protein
MMDGGAADPADGLAVELVVEVGLPAPTGGSVPVEPEPAVVPVLVPVVVPVPLVCAKAGCNSANPKAAIVVTHAQMRGDIPPSCGGLIMPQIWPETRQN